MFVSIRVINYKDFSPEWIMGKINSYMSAWGYALSGTCEVPLQNEYIYVFENSEPSLEELEKNLKQVIFGVELELDSYTID